MKDWEKFWKSPKAPKSAPPGCHRPILELASERIWKAFKRVLKTGKKIGKTGTAEELHRLRLHCKKLRYLITFFRSLYPRESLAPITKELKRLQDHLGDFNDCQVQREALKTFAEELMASGKGPPATLLAMGQLMGQFEGAQIREREAFQATFEEFSRPKNQKRFRKLFGPSPGSGKPRKEGKKAK
jgi:CHAD domain-containing protein